MTDCAGCSGRGWTLRDGRIDVCSCGTYEAPKWVRNGDRPCLLSHFNDPNRPRRAAVGWLCNGHMSRLEQMIAELPNLYDELGLMLTSSEKPGEQGRSKNSQVAGGVNLNKFVVDARDEIHAECVRMIREISEANGDTLPILDTLPALAVWLGGRLDFIAAQDDVDDTYANLQRLTSGCKRLAYPNGRRRIEVGPCGEGDCPGTLVTVTSRTADLLPETIWCDECEREIPPRDWRKLRERITGKPSDVTLTVTQAADAYGVPYRTLARWVADERLTNVGDGFPAMVKASEVEELMETMGVLHDTPTAADACNAPTIMAV